MHRLAIDICIRGVVDNDNIWMRRIFPLTFVPMEGMRFKVYMRDEKTDDEYERDIALENIHYSFRDGMFIEEQNDDTLLDIQREGKPVIYSEKQDYILDYENLGFMRLNFPQAQVIYGSEAQET